jgi:hypothetical protein
MKLSNLILAAALSTCVLAGGCAKKETPVEKAVDGTKDALDIRDHEKLKDGAEDARDAVKDTAEGVKDAAKGEH